MSLDAGQPEATPEAVPAKLVERYDYDPYGRTYIAHWDATAGHGWSGRQYWRRLVWFRPALRPAPP
jgi:hypothetical protein